MYDFHYDHDKYFDTQKDNCEKFVIPFIEERFKIGKGVRALEIGCGSAGVLAAFLEKGCTGAGIDISEDSINFARKKLGDRNDVILIAKDIYSVDIDKDLNGKFDIIILKDVIEHIHNQEKLIALLKNLLNPDGAIFFGFPPWQMPFGGHQQICRSKILSRTPYLHLLPMSLYKKVLKSFGEGLEGLVEIKKTGISIEKFERIVNRTGYKIVNRQFHLINPIYEYKFGMKMRRQSRIISAIPYFRDFVTTSAFYLITPNN
jgi:2-polyprenyl-3-methyl-5-hydroxy-6-metoxy-1,4-benzoquinol methylase